MEVRTDKEYLRKLVDAINASLGNYLGESMEGAERYRGREDINTILYYFNWLAVKAVDDRETAEELAEALDDLKEIESPAQPLINTMALLMKMTLKCKYSDADRTVKLEGEIDGLTFCLSRLVLKAIDDEEFAEGLQEPLEELRGVRDPVDKRINSLVQTVKTARRVKYPTDDMPTEEELEEKFDETVERLDLDRVDETGREVQKFLSDTRDSGGGREHPSDERATNQMYA